MTPVSDEKKTYMVLPLPVQGIPGLGRIVQLAEGEIPIGHELLDIRTEWIHILKQVPDESYARQRITKKEASDAKKS